MQGVREMQGAQEQLTPSKGPERIGKMHYICARDRLSKCSVRHRGGRIKKINAWYLNTLMVYL